MKAKSYFSFGRVSGLLVPLVLLATTAAVEAGDFVYSVNSPDTNTVTIAGCISQSAAVIVPDALDGYSVTAIGRAAFSSCTNLVNVAISSNITSIGDGAFLGCSNVLRVCFKGDAPEGGDCNLFPRESRAMVYFGAGADGWKPKFGGRPTVKVYDPAHSVDINDPSWPCGRWSATANGAKTLVDVTAGWASLWDW